MKKQVLMTTACFASLCGALHGQTADKGSIAFQYFVTDDKATGNFTYAAPPEGFGMRTATGKPLSATEERQTLQVLGDGTRIDKKETDKYYRDSEGRTRIERDGGATVIISDPVSGFTAEMSTASKTAHKMMVMRADTRSRPQEGAALDKFKAEMTAARPVLMAAPTLVTPTLTTQGQSGAVFSRSDTIFISRESKEAQRVPTEDLGTQIVNGVPAQGTRSTITIPLGQIGNDREIKVVSERWFSTDLQMLVKSGNNDPRFGETTYQLTNIVQGAQDPSLFQIPADFSVNGPR